MPATEPKKVVVEKWGRDVFTMSKALRVKLDRMKKQIGCRGSARDTQIDGYNFTAAQLARMVLELCGEIPMDHRHPFVKEAMPPMASYTGIDVIPMASASSTTVHMELQPSPDGRRRGHNFFATPLSEETVASIVQHRVAGEEIFTTATREHEEYVRHFATALSDKSLSLHGFAPSGQTSRYFSRVIHLNLPFGWWMNGGKETVLKVLFLSPRFNGQKDDNGNDLNVHGYWNIPVDVKKLIFEAIFENQYMGPVIDYVTAQRQAESASASASALGSASASASGSVVEEIDDFFDTVSKNLGDE